MMNVGKDHQNFVTSFHFVPSFDKDARKASRLHAIRESARKHRWLRNQNRVSPVDDGAEDSVSSDGNDPPTHARSRWKPASQAWRHQKSQASSGYTSSSREDEDEISNNSMIAIYTQKPTSILAGNTDPFGAYPVPNTNRHLDTLVDYCKVCFDYDIMFYQLSNI